MSNYQEQGSIRPYLPGVIAFAVVIVLTIGGFQLVRINYRMAAQAEFEQYVQERVVAIRRSFRDKLLILESVHSMYSVFHGQPGQEFGAFVRPFEAELAGLQALQWVARVSDADRDSFEEERRQAGYSGYQITERRTQGVMVRADRRGEYYPVFPLETLDRDEITTGFDLYSEPIRREAMELARDTGEITATSRVRLLAEQEPGQFGFLVFAPVYNSAAFPASIQERRQSIRGFVIAVFRFHDAVEAALEVLKPEGVDLIIRDLSAAAGNQLLYEHKSQDPAKAENIAGIFQSFEPDAYTMTLSFGGRTWSITGYPTPYFMAGQRQSTEWLILIAGLVFALSLAFYLMVTSRQAEQMRAVEAALVSAHSELERRVEERTMDLQAVQEELLNHSRLATLGQLTATVSHELRNPLGTALSSIDFLDQLLQGHELEKSSRSAINRLNRAIGRCDRIIDELLDYTRLRVRSRKTVAVNSLVAVYLDDHPLPEDVVLDMKLDGEKAYVSVDEELLCRVLINIIDNAVQAMAENRNTKKLSIRTDTGNGRCRILIRDNGTGMTEETRNRIFDPLYSTKTYGVGLGMAIVKQIMEQLQGEVDVESKPDQGTTVTLMLPLADPPIA